jgi:hypothetical protein
MGRIVVTFPILTSWIIPTLVTLVIPCESSPLSAFAQIIVYSCVLCHTLLSSGIPRLLRCNTLRRCRSTKATPRVQVGQMSSRNVTGRLQVFVLQHRSESEVSLPSVEAKRKERGGSFKIFESLKPLPKKKALIELLFTWLAMGKKGRSLEDLQMGAGDDCRKFVDQLPLRIGDHFLLFVLNGMLHGGPGHVADGGTNIRVVLAVVPGPEHHMWTAVRENKQSRLGEREMG